ncbi:MAG: helical backbone metal receptor [Phycisphaerae bacterium]
MPKKNLLIFVLIITVIAAVLSVTAVYRIKTENTNNTDAAQTEPQRIVSLAPNITEILFALGLDEKIVAVSSDSDCPPAAKEKEKVGSFWQPSTERIIACKPDLVITEWFEQQNLVAQSLKRLNYKVLTFRLTNLGELSAAIEQIGQACFRQQQAAELVQKIENRLNDLRNEFDVPDKPKVLWVVEQQPTRVAGTETFVSELIKFAGGINAIGPTVQHYPQLSSEEILASKADIIIQSSMTQTSITQQQKSAEQFWSRYPSLAAVRNKRIYVIESDMMLRLGPRIVDGVEVIGKLIHPELFEQK